MTIKMHKCRVAGPCGWCDRWIEAGDEYESQLWHDEEERYRPMTLRFHPECGHTTRQAPRQLLEAFPGVDEYRIRGGWIDPNTDEICYHKSPDLQEPA
jgi:hypothetical protein